MPGSARGGIARIEAVADYLDPAPVAELVIFADPPRLDPARLEPRYAG